MEILRCCLCCRPSWRQLRLGAEPGGLTGAQVHRIIADARAAADVVGFTIAEYFTRHVMHMQQIMQGLPLIGDRRMR
jgi:arginase